MTAPKNASGAFYQQPFASAQAAALIPKYDPNFLPVGNPSSLYALGFSAHLHSSPASNLLPSTAYPGHTNQLFNAFATDPSSTAHVLQPYAPLIDPSLKLDPFFDQPSSWDSSALIPENLIGDTHSNTSSPASFELSKLNRGRVSNPSIFDPKASSNSGVQPPSSTVASVVNYRSGTIERYNQSSGSSRGPSPLVLFGSQSNAVSSLPLVGVPNDTAHISTPSSTPAIPLTSNAPDFSRQDPTPTGAASATRVTASVNVGTPSHIPAGVISSSSGTARGPSPPVSSTLVPSSSSSNAISSNATAQQQRASSSSPQLPNAGTVGRWVPPSIISRKSKNASLPSRASGSRDANAIESREGKDREPTHAEVVSKRLRGYWDELCSAISILNKLTPGNFEKLYYDILSVGFASQVSIKELVSLIVEKAVWERKYCSLYAELCHRFALQVDIDAGDAQTQPQSLSARPSEQDEAPARDSARNTYLAGLSKFHEQLLAKVQLEFESRNTLDASTDAWPDLSGSSREEKERIRMLGIVKFLAELGKRGLVQETVLHLCIRELLQKPHSVPPTPSLSSASTTSGSSGTGASSHPLRSTPAAAAQVDSSSASSSVARTNAISSNATTSSSSNTLRVQQAQQPIANKSNAKDKDKEKESASSKTARAGHQQEHKEAKQHAPASNVKPNAAAIIDQSEPNLPLSSEEMRLTCNNIECVCNLLKLVGPMLDTSKAKNLMSQYMSRLSRLLKKYGRSLPSRVRFQLEDLLELRAKGWQFQTVGQVAAAEQNAALPLAAMQQLRGLYEWMEDKGSTSENSSEGASGGRDDLLGLDPYGEQNSRTNGVYRQAATQVSSDRSAPAAVSSRAAANSAAVTQQQQAEKQNGSSGTASSKPEKTPIAAPVAPASVDWTELDQMPSSSSTGHLLESESVSAHFDWASSSTTTSDQRPSRAEREAEPHNTPAAPPKQAVIKPKPTPQVAPDALFLPAFCKFDHAAKAAAAASAKRSTRYPVRSASSIPLTESTTLKAPERPPSTGSVSNSSEASQCSTALGGTGEANNGGEAGKKTKRLVLLHSTGQSGGEAGRGAQFDAADMLTPAFARGRYVVPKATDGDSKAAKRAPPGTAWNKVGVKQPYSNAMGGQLQQQQQSQQQQVSAGPGSTVTSAINSDALDAFLPQFASVSLSSGQPSRRATNRSTPRARE